MHHNMKPVAPLIVQKDDGIQDVACKKCGSKEYDPAIVIKKQKTMVVGEELVFAISVFVCHKCRERAWMPMNQPITPVGPAEEGQIIHKNQEIVN